MITDAELRKSFKVFYEGNTIYVVGYKRMASLKESTRKSELIGRQVMDILDSGKRDYYNIFVDLTNIKNVSNFPKELGKKHVQLAADKRVKKVAIVMNSNFSRALINLTVIFSGRKDLFKAFKDKKKALEWLKDDKDLSEDFKVSLMTNSIIEVQVLTQHHYVDDAVRAARIAGQKVQEIFDKSLGRRFGIFLDITRLKMSDFPQEVREEYGKIAKNKKIKKVAVYGKSHMMKMFTNLIAALIGRRSTVRYFFKKDKAINWLKE